MALPSPGPPYIGMSNESPLYTTPASQSVSQAGQDNGLVSVSKVGLAVAHSPNEFCLGVIRGELKRWCTSLRAKCKTQRHPFSRLNVEENIYYICYLRVGQSRFEPRLSVMCQL